MREIQANFTMFLRDVIAEGYELPLNDYPIPETWTIEDRKKLNAKIVSHYWLREIGQETPELFIMFFDMKIKEIMPYYSNLYSVALNKANVFQNINITNNNTINANGESVTANNLSANIEGKISNTGKEYDTLTSRSLVSDTPQTQLSGNEDYASGLADENTKQTKSFEDRETVSTSSNTQNDEQISNTNNTSETNVTQTGLTGAFEANALQAYRDSLIDIDMMIITELEPLFMGIYSSNYNLL